MTTEADSPVRTERRGAALWLWLNRPNALNSLTLPMVRGLHQGLDLAADPDVRVVVIAGKGRAFCAGADLTQVLGWVSGDAEPAAEDDFLQQVGAAFDRLEAFEKPVIAAVHGLAVAGGALDQAARRGTADCSPSAASLAYVPPVPLSEPALGGSAMPGSLMPALVSWRGPPFVRRVEQGEGRRPGQAEAWDVRPDARPSSR